MARPLRLMIFDATCRGPAALVPGLTAAWRAGGALYGALGRFEASRGVRSWAEALDWLAAVSPGARIGEVQYWGHGTWGRLMLAREALEPAALAPGHALHARLAAVRARLVPDGSALWWFRTCETFGTAAGHDFARAWTRFFGCRAAGHTHVIGALQSGLHSLAAGASPRWPLDEGVPPGVAAPRAALPSRWGAVNTITCLHGEVPAGF